MESISPLCSIIENYSNKEILERVYTQIQSFLNDPTLKEEEKEERNEEKVMPINARSNYFGEETNV